jgi:hypothetical protein
MLEVVKMVGYMCAYLTAIRKKKKHI